METRIGGKRAAHLSVVAMVLTAGAALPVAAQSFNIDFGSALGRPSATYPGAASQPGYWHVSNGGDGLPERLVDVRGVKSEVTFTEYDLPFGPASTNNAGTTGGDQALLDDYLDLHNSPARFAIEGLAAGRYAFFTYAWAPDNPAARTFVSVNNVDSQAVGGEWDGFLQFGVTYAQHQVTVESGERVVISTFGLGVGTLNGIQIVSLGP